MITLERSDIERILYALENMRQRQPMYLEAVNIEAMVNFIHGFNLGIFTLGFKIPDMVYEQAYKQRGWEYTARGAWQDMRDRGLSEETIMDELLAVEMDAWRLLDEKII